MDTASQTSSASSVSHTSHKLPTLNVKKHRRPTNTARSHTFDPYVLPIIYICIIDRYPNRLLMLFSMTVSIFVYFIWTMMKLTIWLSSLSVFAFIYFCSSIPPLSQRSSRSSRSIGKQSTSSLSKRSGYSEFQPQVIVKDEQGKDVTPVSLLSLKPSVLQQHTILMNDTSASPLVILTTNMAIYLPI